MAGPDEAGWQTDLAALADSLGIGARVTWTGMLTGAVKWGAYRAADAFIRAHLPLGELRRGDFPRRWRAACQSSSPTR